MNPAEPVESMADRVAEIVQDCHGRIAVEQRSHEVPSDEPGATGNEDLHDCLFTR